MGPSDSIRDADRYRAEGPGRKQFRKGDMEVVSKDETKDDEQQKKSNAPNKSKFDKATDQANLKAEQTIEKKPQNSSLFDLLKQQKISQEEEEDPIATVGEEPDFIKDPKDMALSSTMFSSKGEKTNDQGEMQFSEEEKKRLAGIFVQEQPDLSYVNPAQVQKIELASIYTPTPPKAPQVDMLQRIKEIVDQIGDMDLYSKKEDGKTETVITLNNIDKFEGARVVVTSFDTAKGQFNIAFENLTQQGKSLLDKNQEALMQMLAKKGGWVVHQITTTTLSPERAYIDDTQKRDRENNPEENPRERQRRQPRQ